MATTTTTTTAPGGAVNEPRTARHGNLIARSGLTAATVLGLVGFILTLIGLATLQSDLSDTLSGGGDDALALQWWTWVLHGILLVWVIALAIKPGFVANHKLAAIAFFVYALTLASICLNALLHNLDNLGLSTGRRRTAAAGFFFLTFFDVLAILALSEAFAGAHGGQAVASTPGTYKQPATTGVPTGAAVPAGAGVHSGNVVPPATHIGHVNQTQYATAV
jgi:hypothetical protein